jgi:hypothetical protein
MINCVLPAAAEFFPATLALTACSLNEKKICVSREPIPGQEPQDVFTFLAITV